MSVLPVAHAFFTNAYGAGRGGFRHLDLRLPGSPEDRERLRRWLGGLRPLGEPVGWAVRAFRLGGVLHAVLARVVPEFARDEFGRAGGYLCHALLAPLDEGGPVVRSGLALRAAALRMAPPELAELPDRERLDACLALCERELEIDAPVLDAASLASLLRAVPAQLVSVVCDASAEAPATLAVPQTPNGDLAGAVLRASEVLPPRLHLGLRWCVAAASTGLPAKQFQAEPGAPGGRGLYGRWVARSLVSGRADDVLVIAQDWEIRDERSLGEALDALGLLPEEEL